MNAIINIPNEIIFNIYNASNLIFIEPPWAKNSVCEIDNYIIIRVIHHNRYIYAIIDSSDRPILAEHRLYALAHQAVNASKEFIILRASDGDKKYLSELLNFNNPRRAGDTLDYRKMV